MENRFAKLSQLPTLSVKWAIVLDLILEHFAHRNHVLNKKNPDPNWRSYIGEVIPGWYKGRWETYMTTLRCELVEKEGDMPAYDKRIDALMFYEIELKESWATHKRIESNQKADKSSLKLSSPPK